MTIGELIKELEKYDKSLPIFIEVWSDGYGPIQVDNFKVATFRNSETEEIVELGLMDLGL